MTKPKTTAPETEPTNAELDEAALEQVSGGAWYAKFDGVDGSSRSDAHHKWIEIESFSYALPANPVAKK